MRLTHVAGIISSGVRHGIRLPSPMTAGVRAHRAHASRHAPGLVSEYRARGPALCGNTTRDPSTSGRDGQVKYSRKVRAQSLIPSLLCIIRSLKCTVFCRGYGNFVCVCICAERGRGGRGELRKSFDPVSSIDVKLRDIASRRWSNLLCHAHSRMGKRA
jgi:hypothetical protein